MATISVSMYDSDLVDYSVHVVFLGEDSSPTSIEVQATDIQGCVMMESVIKSDEDPHTSFYDRQPATYRRFMSLLNRLSCRRFNSGQLDQVIYQVRTDLEVITYCD